MKVCGLMGGHSGAEIDKNRANANKLMDVFSMALRKKQITRLFPLEGGKDNAITRECTAEFLTDLQKSKSLRKRTSGTDS